MIQIERKKLEKVLETLEVEYRMYEATDPETGAPYNMIEAITIIKDVLAQEPEPENRCVRELREFAKANQETYIFPLWDGRRVLKYLNKAIPAQKDSEPVAWRYALDASVEGPRWIYIDEDPEQWLNGPAMVNALIEPLYTKDAL